MSATLHLVWDRLGRGRRTEGEVEDVPLGELDPVDVMGRVEREIRAIARDNVIADRYEVLVLPEGQFAIQGGAFGSGTWSLVGA